MITSISSEAQKYHGMDKQTKLDIAQMFSVHNKKKDNTQKLKENHKTFKIMFAYFQA